MERLRKKRIEKYSQENKSTSKKSTSKKTSSKYFDSRFKQKTEQKSSPKQISKPSKKRLRSDEEDSDDYDILPKKATNKNKRTVVFSSEDEEKCKDEKFLKFQ